MAKFKKGVSVDTSGKITIDKSVQGVSDATRKAVSTRNANIEAGTPEKNVVGAPTPQVPGEAASTLAGSVVKTEALQRRIDARKAKTPTDQSVIDTATGQPQVAPEAPTTAQPVDQSVIDTATGLPQGVEAPKKEPTTTETTVTKETITPEEKPALTPEEQAKFDEQQKQQEEDRLKAEEDKQKADALKAEEAKKQAEANQKGETVVKTQDEAFAILSTGGKLPKTAENAKFESRFKAYQKLNGLTNQSLADLNAQGMIDSNYLDYLSKNNPERFGEINKLTDSAIKIDDINKTSERIYNKATGKPTETLSKSEEVDRDIAKVINGDKPSIRDLRNKFLNDNEKIKDLKVGLAEKDGEIEELQDEIERTYDDLRGQYPTLPKSILMGMAATQTRDLNRTLTTKMRERNILFSEYQAEKEDANAMMNFEMQVVAEERANRQEQLTYLQNKFNTYKKDEDWEKEKAFQTEAATIAYNRGDIQAAKQHERNLEVLDLGQKFQAEESKKQRDQAMEIVKLQMKGAGVNFSAPAEDENGQFIVVTDSKNGTAKKVYLNDVTIPEETTTAPDGTQIGYGFDNGGNYTADFGPTGIVNTNSNGVERDECAMVVNDRAGLSMGDTYESKLKFTQKGKQPQVGDVFVSPKGVMYNGKNTGHTGFVKTVFPDGSIELWESNLVKDANGNGVTSTRIIKPTDEYYKTLQFGKTRLTKDTTANNKQALKDPRVITAINKGARVAKGKYANENYQKDLEYDIKNFGLGSQEVIDNMVSIAAIDDKDGFGKALVNMKKLDDFLERYDDFKKKYPDSDVFGLKGDVEARINKIKDSLGNPNLPPETKARVQAEFDMLTLMQDYRRQMTGAAASILEAGEYKKLFPDGSTGKNVAMAQLEGFRRLLKNQVEGQMTNIFGVSGYNALMGKKKNFYTTQDQNFKLANDVMNNGGGYQDFVNNYLNK